MESIPTFRPFETTGILWKDISPKFEFYNLNVIADVLNTRLDLKKYGSTVEKLMFVFIAVKPSNTIHSEKTGYISTEKRLLLYRKLAYEKVSIYSKEEVLRLMAETYIKSIFDLGENEIPDFDYIQLGKEIEKVFIELGWIVSNHYYPVSRKIQATTVTAFLQSKGWKVLNTTHRYQVMSPSKNDFHLKNTQIYIPLSPNGHPDKYKRAMSDMILRIAEIYKMERMELELLFSKNSEQLMKDITMIQGLVAQNPR